METRNRKELIVNAIENGTVIDHIKSGTVLHVLRILNLESFEDQIYLGANLPSKKYGKKGIIKVTNRFFEADEINKIALVSPTATIIEISNFKITKKTKVTIPDCIVKIVKCFNPNCITNHEVVEAKFNVINKEELKLQCLYCEKTMTRDNISFH